MNGVSVIVCCYNSADRIGSTLEHLIAQQVQDIPGYEIIVVDNNCKDNTVMIAKSLLESSSISFKIVEQTIPGLSAARNKGVSESNFDFLIFCDDDNWLNPNYASNAYKYLSQGNTIVGGHGTLYSETEKPNWFDNYEKVFACGKQNPNKPIYGAGMCIQKNFLTMLDQLNWQHTISDRIGDKLISGGDTELCYICLLLDHKIEVPVSGLEFQHAIPSSRLTMSYVDQFNYWNGYSSFIISSYEDLFIQNTSFIRFFPLWWSKRFFYLIKMPLKKDAVLNRSSYKGYFKSFIKNGFSVFNYTNHLIQFLNKNKTKSC